MHAHTHIHAYKTKEDRKFKCCGKHTLLSRNTCNIKYTKEKLICGCLLKEKKIDYFLKPENTASLWKQSFHGCKTRVKKRRKKGMSEAAKFIFPSSNVSAH